MLVTVGRIVRAHGVRGEVAVDVRTDAPDERFAPGHVLVARAGRGARAGVRAGARAGSGGRPGAGPRSGGPALPTELTVERVRRHHGRLLVVFAGISDRDAAEALRGTELLVDVGEDDRPDDPDEYFDHQLTGLTVVDTTGRELGEVSSVIHGPAQDVISVRSSGGAETLVPFVSQLVPEVDLAAGRLVVDPPAGLFELDGSDEEPDGDAEPAESEESRE